MSLVEMRGISKHFGATVALDGVDLFLEPGEVHALVGENGSGKSTLMRILAGALPPDSGNVNLDGNLFQPADPLSARKSGVAMIYQELALCPDLTVADNILLGMESPLIHAGNSRAKAKAALAQLGHGGLDVDQPLRKLPLALCQIVEIARAVATGSKVLILDEPTSSLSEPDVKKLFEVIRSLRDSGHAVVYISHFLDEIEQIADRITILRDGQLVATKFPGELSRDQIVSLMVGRMIDDAFPRSAHQAGELILDLRNVSGEVKPQEASLQLHRGEVVGIAGLNGSGRSELLRTIFGLDEVRSGHVTVKSMASKAAPFDRWRQGVGMLSEDRKSEGLALNLSIADNLTLTRLPSLVSESKQQSDAQTWIERSGVKCRNGAQAVSELSGGNQQKVAFARLLYHDVDLLLLDEPTRGIDVGSKQQIYAMIDELAEQGKAVLIVSSYLPELLGICDRIAVMNKGVLGEAIPVDQLDQETIMRHATA